jgi:hypothetical protein
MVSSVAQGYLSLDHIPMVFGYGDMSRFFGSRLRCLTLGLNPAPPESELNQFVVGDLAKTHTKSLVDAYVVDGSLHMESVDYVQAACTQYFANSPHKYFVPLERVLNEVNCSYFGGLPNTAIHIDIFRWSTSSRWSELPNTVRQEMVTVGTAALQSDLKLLKPKIIIISIEIGKVMNIFKDVAWKTLVSFSKTQADAVVRYSVVRLREVGTVCLVQTTPTPLPFGFLTIQQQKEVGTRLQDIINSL